MLTLLTLWGLYLFIGQLSAAQLQTTRAQNAAVAMAEAKQALLGDAIAQITPYLRLPDIGMDGFGVPEGGNAAANFTGNAKDYSVLGKYPWKTLGVAPLHDQYGECLWYAVSGRFKISPATDALNWDTLGQIDVIDGSGNTIATNLAALLVAPGPAIDSQSRTLADPAYKQCGGNYDAQNFLDTYSVANAVAGEVNYFAGSTNNRVALNSNNKRFVMTQSDYYNDRFLYVRVDDIFTPLIRRNLLPAHQRPSGRPRWLPRSARAQEPRAPRINCTLGHAPDDAFCKNWKACFPNCPRQRQQNAVPSGSCSRVLLFSGRKIAGQSRLTAAEKADKNNYLEGVNAASFNAPTAVASNFSGNSTFDWHNPGADLVRCLP
ncbi:MAG: hypothetical protein IPI21_15855 [Propionivibrio sp.]|nr:hypothetical protein [Propionivibrio sp.]